MEPDGWITRILTLPSVVTVNQQALSREIEHTADLMSKLFEIPDLPPITVLFKEETRRGGYHPQTETAPRSIGISRFGTTPRLTFAHEFGHYLDDALGKFEVYYSQLDDSFMQPVKQVIEQTDALIMLRASEQITRGQSNLKRYEVLRLLEAPELWARAFAQYVVVRSGDSVMGNEIDLRRSDPEQPYAAQEYWSFQDFAPVVVAINRMFRALGWSYDTR